MPPTLPWPSRRGSVISSRCDFVLASMESLLRLLARTHSQDTATRGYVGHGSMSGESFVDRLARAHNAFIVSPGHLQNVLELRFHRVGIGVSTAGQLGMTNPEDFFG